MAEITGGPIQTASSLGYGSRSNSDGTIIVRCRICHNSITDIDGRNRFYSATCAVCVAEDAGIILTAEQELQLRSMRFPDGRRIPMSAITPMPSPDPMVGNENKVGRPEYFWKTVVRKVEAVAKVIAKKATKQYKEETAQELANRKRHKPLFQGGVEVNVKSRRTDEG